MRAHTPLVLLHPYPTDAGYWEPMRAHLHPRRPVLCPQVPREEWRVPGMADDVAARIREWSPTATAAVMGLSMGGYIALSIAAEHPGCLRALVLADTRAEADDEAARAARGAAIERIAREGPDGYLRDFLPRLVAPGADAAVHEQLSVLAARQTGASLTRALRALALRPDRTGALPGVRVPTLVMVGEHDGLTPQVAAETMARGIPGAELRVVPGAGHMAALERPREVAALVEGFLGPIDAAA